MPKVTYFTASEKATADELADIAALNALSNDPYEILVRNGAQSNSYGAGPDATDYVAGTIPDEYSDTEDFPVFDVDNPPVPGLDDTQAVVSDGEALTVPVTGTYATTATVTVVDGAVTAIVLS